MLPNFSIVVMDWASRVNVNVKVETAPRGGCLAERRRGCRHSLGEITRRVENGRLVQLREGFFIFTLLAPPSLSAPVSPHFLFLVSRDRAELPSVSAWRLRRALSFALPRVSHSVE